MNIIRSLNSYFYPHIINVSHCSRGSLYHCKCHLILTEVLFPFTFSLLGCPSKAQVGSWLSQYRRGQKMPKLNIITKHKHYFQIQIFHKSISYLLESMFKCKIKFEDIIVFSFKGLAILGCIHMHYNAGMDDSLWYDITTMEFYYTI